MQDFDGKVAVVTGAANGIGRGIADRLVREGMKVVLADIEEPALDQAVAELQAEGHDVTGIPTDVSSRASVEALADGAYAAYGAVHLLCNNAAVTGYIEGPAWEATSNDWTWTMGVNFWGVVNGVETFLPRMLASGEPATIVNTSSVAAFGSANILYSVSKHAVQAYSELTFNHVRELGLPVKVSVLIPGASATNMSVRARNRPAELENPPDPARERIGEIQRRRMHEVNSAGTTPAEVADRLIEGLMAEQFYIFVDGRFDEHIKARFDAVLAREDPPRPGRPTTLRDDA